MHRDIGTGFKTTCSHPDVILDTAGAVPKPAERASVQLLAVFKAAVSDEGLLDRLSVKFCHFQQTDDSLLFASDQRIESEIREVTELTDTREEVGRCNTADEALHAFVFMEGHPGWPGAEARLRDRTAVTSPSLRRIEMIPPMEIDEGLVDVLETSFGATEDEAVSAIARGLGFKSTSSQLRELIVSRIALQKGDGTILERDGMLTIAPQQQV